MTETYQHGEKTKPLHRSIAHQAASNTMSFPAVPVLQKKNPEEDGLQIKSESQHKSSVKKPVIQKKGPISLSGNITCSGLVYQLKEIFQLAKRNKKKNNDDSDDEWVPPAKRRKHRQTFSKKIRKKVIRRGALRNKNRLYVCPGCGMPLADRKGNEIKTFYISKSRKRHNIVSGQLDHYPPWRGRLEKLKKQKKSDEEIRRDHDDVTRLRPLCLRCNASHKYENVKNLPDEGYSDEEYFSDDEERDKEIWKKYRKDDNNGSGGSGSLAV